MCLHSGIGYTHFIWIPPGAFFFLIIHHLWKKSLLSNGMRMLIMSECDWVFKIFLESYIDVCNNIVTESANAVLMFEAGEQSAFNIKTSKIEDIIEEFKKIGLTVIIEKDEKKVTFHVKGLNLTGKSCRYCNILRGFFGGIARKHIDSRYYCRKCPDCIIEGAERCTFVAELLE